MRSIFQKKQFKSVSAELEPELVNWIAGGHTLLSLNRYERKKDIPLAVKALKEVIHRHALSSGACAQCRLVIAGMSIFESKECVPLVQVLAVEPHLAIRIEHVCQHAAACQHASECMFCFVTSHCIVFFEAGTLKHLCNTGGYDERVSENVQHFKELRQLAEQLGVQDRVVCLRNISDAQRCASLYGSRLCCT